MNRKAGGGVLAIAIIVCLIFLVAYIVEVAGRECSKNSQCKGNHYCGADHKCHEYPSQVVVQKNSFLAGAIVLGAAMIAAAYIFRGGKNPFRRKSS